VSADHGDEFWEHGSCGHGHSLYQELISVPLMIRWPNAFPAGRFTAGSEGVDLLPTMIELMGAELSEGAQLQGRSLLPQLSATEAYPQAYMASQGTERFALTLNRAKVIFRGRGSIESYNLSRDKKEARDLYKEDAVLTSTALDPLILYLARPRTWDKAQWGAPNALSASFPSELPKAWLKPAKRRRGSKR
jgi:arylsulfatase A-like enzyme